MEDPTLERTFRGHKGPVTSLSFDPRLTRLASGSLDGTIMLWHFNPRLRATRLAGHAEAVHSVDFAPGGSGGGSGGGGGALLVSASADSTVRLWGTRAMRGNAASGGPGGTSGGSIPRGHSGPCGETVLRGHGGPVRCAVFSRGDGGAHIASCGDDKQVKVWDTARGCFARGLSGHSNWVRSCDFSPDGRLVVSGGDDGTVRLWDVASRDAVRVHQNHSTSSSGSVSTGTSPVTGVRFHSDGSCVASTSNDGSVRLWDVRTGRLLQHYGAHKDAAHSVAFHPSGGYLLSASSDATARVWDLHEGHLFYTLIGHEGPVLGCAVSGDGEFLASGGADGQVMVWRANFWAAGDDNNTGAAAVAATASAAAGSTAAAAATTATKTTRKASSSTSSSSAATSRRTEVPEPRAAWNNASPARGSIRSGVGFREFSDSVFEPERMGSSSSNSRRGASSSSSSRRVSVRPKTGPSTTYEQTVHEVVREDDNVTSDGPDGRRSNIPVTEAHLGNAATARFAQTLEHIVSQLDVLTQTVALLDRRISMNEDRIQAVEAPRGGAPGRVPLGGGEESFDDYGYEYGGAPGAPIDDDF
jgi:centriolar protein POC1